MTSPPEDEAEPLVDEGGSEDLGISLPAVPDSVTALRWMARDFACDRGADDGLAGDVMLAVSEAVTNAVKHAYPAAGGGAVELLATVAGGKQLEVVVRDGGAGFRPGASEGLGAGLMLMRECADAVVVDDGPGGVTVRMTFQLR
jgi:anti-sigma regulatory factor (Ser/Thr protein kinase)